MVSEKSVKGKSLDFRNLEIPVLPYFATPYDNSSDFCLPLEVEQFLDLHTQVMYEGEDSTSQLQFGVQNSEVLKAELDCGLTSAPRRPEPFSRQSSLTEEWFGNVSNAHPNDISVDSSLEALFASTDWQSLEEEMPVATDAAVTDNCLVDPSLYQSVNCEPADDIQHAQTVVSKSLPELSTVCGLQLIVPEKVGECSSQKTEGTFHGFVLVNNYKY